MTSPAPDATPADKRRRGLRNLLILNTIATLVLAPLALFWALIASMATTTTNNAAFANAYVWVNLTLPAAMVLCMAAAWIAWARKREALVWPIILAPLIWVFASLSMMAAWPHRPGPGAITPADFERQQPL